MAYPRPTSHKLYIINVAEASLVLLIGPGLDVLGDVNGNTTLVGVLFEVDIATWCDQIRVRRMVSPRRMRRPICGSL